LQGSGATMLEKRGVLFKGEIWSQFLVLQKAW
jgi:hypothetical protein